MNKKIFRSVILIIILILVWFTFKNSTNRNQNSLLNPGIIKPVSSSAPTVVPKTFKFDKTTDLKKELDSVQPQLQNSDFE